jgi:hypothetical protein
MLPVDVMAMPDGEATPPANAFRMSSWAVTCCRSGSLMPPTAGAALPSKPPAGYCEPADDGLLLAAQQLVRPVEEAAVCARLGFIFVVLRFTANATVEVRWPIGKTIGVLLAGPIPLLIIVEHAHHGDEGAVRPLKCRVRGAGLRVGVPAAVVAFQAVELAFPASELNVVAPQRHYHEAGSAAQPAPSAYRNCVKDRPRRVRDALAVGIHPDFHPVAGPDSCRAPSQMFSVLAAVDLPPSPGCDGACVLRQV